MTKPVAPMALYWADPPSRARAQGPHLGVHVIFSRGVWSDCWVLFLLHCTHTPMHTCVHMVQVSTGMPWV